MATLQGSMDTISSCAEAQVQALEAAKASAGDETSQRVSTVKVSCAEPTGLFRVELRVLSAWSRCCLSSSLQASIGELQAVVDTSVTHAEAVGERVKTDSDTAMAALLEHTEAAASMVAAAHNDLSSGAEQVRSSASRVPYYTCMVPLPG